MPRKVFIIVSMLLLAAAGCPPRDDPGPKGTTGPGPGERKGTEVKAVKNELPPTLKERLDAARQHIRERYIPTSHAFWTVFHGILGIGPENAMLFDMESGKKVKAIDHVCNGGIWNGNVMRGLDFRSQPDGTVEVLTRPGTGTYQGHQDQFIAEMAQWGMPRDKVFMIRGKKHTFDDFIRYARNKASINRDEEKQELSWAIIIIAQYYGTDHRWTNSRKEELTLEDALRYEINEPIDTAACGGTHRLFGITWVYHLHRAKGGKKEGVWRDAAEHLEKYKKAAHDYQNRDGSFSTKYLSEAESGADPDLRINTTGHVFEWLSLAMTDEELRLPWMTNAAEALIKMILESSDRGIDAGSLYHAAHGLEIYRFRLYGPADAHPPLVHLPPKD